MNDAVAGLDVGHDDGGVINHDVAVDDGDGDLLALDRGGGLAVEGDGGFGIDCSGNDVVRQDVGERGVAEEFFGGEAESIEGGGEGIVGRSEHGERAVTTERLDEAGFGHGGDEGLKGAGADGDVDDGAGTFVLFGHAVVGHLVVARLGGVG